MVCNQAKSDFLSNAAMAFLGEPQTLGFDFLLLTTIQGHNIVLDISCHLLLFKQFSDGPKKSCLFLTNFGLHQLKEKSALRTCLQNNGAQAVQ